MTSQMAHVSRRGTRAQVERMLNASRRRADSLVLVAEQDDQVRGFLSAHRMMRHNLWEDRWVWQVEHLIGRHVLHPLLAEMRRIAQSTPVLVFVPWMDEPKAGALNHALRRMGFDEFGATLMQEAQP